jgi:translocation and assembly module TamB
LATRTTRRRFIFAVSLCTLLVLGLIGLGIGVFLTQTDSGQSGLRRAIQQQVASSIKGKVYIGRLSGNFVTGVTIDSLELRDDQDSLFVATGRVTVGYDVRDLIDRRLRLRQVEVERPVVVLRQNEHWSWNFDRMFASGKKSARRGPERGFGDYVVIDSTHVRNASFRLTIPWHADDSLHGARRDSAIRANIARRDHEIRRTRDGYTQTYRWTKAYAAVPYMRIADPDSAGKLFVIDALQADESVPTFKWRNVAGVVKVLGDTVWIKSPHWDLPGSTGRAAGRVTWGSDLPVRYRLRIWGDSVSLADVAWVYPTLPTTGGGRMILDIKNERNLQQLDFALTEMDVRTTKSRLRGAMTFEIGGPVLSVHDVKLQADPVDWDLLRTLNGKPFPADWQGTLTGTVTARGGPLNRFYVDAANLTFRDAHVPGAISHFAGRGELDILLPAFTKFHHFAATTDRLDLRSITRIYPAFPRVKGLVSGSAVLDSSWLDVRVSNASLTHSDGPGEPTRTTGGGRITYGEKYMTYDMDLRAASLSLTMLARSYPKLPLRGPFAGSIKTRGLAPDLTVEADLTGPAGHITYAGHVDADSVGGYGARGSGTFDNLNAAALVGLATPASRLAGRYDVDLTGDSLATLAGSLSLTLDRSEIDGLQVSSGAARARFDRGVVHIDTLRVDGLPGTLHARGTLGLTRSAGSDSLVLAVDVDSLGGLRRYLKSSATPLIGKRPAVDTLLGDLSFRGSMRGWLDSLDVRGALAGHHINVRSDRAQRLAGTLAVRSIRGYTAGTVDLRADTVVAAGVRVRSAVLAARLHDNGRGRFGIGAATDNGATVRAAGDWRTAGDTTSVRIDTVNVATADARWTLRLPAHFVRSPAGVTLDTLLLANATGGKLAGFVRAPETAPARVHFRADAVPLAELGRLVQLASPLDGRLDADFDVTGTREQPTMTLDATARAVKIGALSAEGFTLTGRYGNERVKLQGNLLRRGRSILDAWVDYPIGLTLFATRPSSDSLRGGIHADSVDLALVEAAAKQLRNTTGRLALDLAISGAPARPHVGGTASVRNGGFDLPDAGVRFAGIEGQFHLDAQRDSLAIDRLDWTSPASAGTASLSGSVVYRDMSNPRLDLRFDAHALRAVDRRSLARLDLSTEPGGLTLVGTPGAATLSGAVHVDRGTIFIPELMQKELEELTLDDFAMLFDTTDVRNRSLMPAAPSRLVEHLRLSRVSVVIGDEVWLRSKEANIKLGGSLNVTRARDDRSAGTSFMGDLLTDTARATPKYTLALSGSLSADRGTYTLDLGLVRREFQVQSGRISFFGTPDFNPAIDVSALYRVKQANRADIAVQARIIGNFYPQPSLELSSNDASIGQSDLVSYLATGRPASELTNSPNAASAVQRASAILLPSGSAWLSQKLRDQFGFVDLFQIQSGALSDQYGSASTNTGEQVRSIFQSTRLGGEKQISDRLFLSFSTGLCPAFSASGDDQNSGLKGLGNSIEGKVEYRFPLTGPNRLSLRGGLDPSASSLRCSGGSVLRGFVQTPQQWGLSVFRSWSF